MSSACLHRGGGGSGEQYLFGVPDDIERLIKVHTYREYLEYLRKGESGRPWGTAPERIPESTAVQPATMIREYDVAISFAGEDRDLAQAIVSGLRARNITVFYDEYEQAELWGKELYAHLHDLYNRKARYCIMLISRHYIAKQWPAHERRAAQQRAFEEIDEAYILPVRIDDVDVPGLPKAIGYVKAAIGTDRICDLVQRSLLAV